MAYFSLSDGEKIYYEDTCTGRSTIIMLHGWISTHREFAPILRAVSKTARCIICDQRGHGNSKSVTGDHVTLDTLAGDLNELIAGLDLRDITLLGWSMGAGVILKYVSLYGCGALRQIVLCDMSPRQINDADWSLGLFQGKLTREFAESTAGNDFYDLYRQFAVGAIPQLARLPDPLLRIVLKRRLNACAEGVAISLSDSIKEADLRPCVEQISVPVHYFYAEPGSLFSPELADWYREHISAPFFSKAFHKSTHMLMREHPYQFAREVIRVLDNKTIT